jgi:hypothetical protein
VFIIFLFYTKRAEADREEEHIRIDEDELDELLDDSDLKVSFIDDEDDDEDDEDDDEEEVVEAVMGEPMVVDGDLRNRKAILDDLQNEVLDETGKSKTSQLTEMLEASQLVEDEDDFTDLDEE